MKINFCLDIWSNSWIIITYTRHSLIMLTKFYAGLTIGVFLLCGVCIFFS